MNTTSSEQNANTRPAIDPGTVVEVYQQGYRLDDTVIRPARVIVAA